MRRISPVLALCVLLASRPVGAQATEYVPSQRLQEGRELVAIYLGSTYCGPCQFVAAGAPVAALDDKKPR